MPPMTRPNCPSRLSRLLTAAAPFVLVAVALPALAQTPLPSPRAPVVIELFQSQGCSSCPPANAYVNAIAGRADVLALSFAVTYWDNLGWKDGFDKPAYTQRQWDYANARSRGEVFTPEVVVNGRHDVVGSNRRDLDRAVADGARDTATVDVALDVASGGGRVSVAASRPGHAADVWLVRYDPRTLNVSIGGGENGGRVLPHRNIVKQLVRLGTYTGAAASFALPAAPEPGLATAALVQGAHGGAILGSAKG